MRRFFRLVFLLLPLLFYTLPAQAQLLGFRLLNNQTQVDIPFETYNNLIVINLTLNDQLPLKFVVDTGVRTTILLDKTYGDFLGLRYARKYTIAGIGEADSIHAWVANNITLAMPGVRGTGHAMLVLEQDQLELRHYLGTEVHGILGYELFSRFIVKFDYSNKLMTLISPIYFRPKKKFDFLPLTVEDTKPYLEGEITYDDGRVMPVKLLVDTGASQGLMLEDNPETGVTVPEKHIYSFLGRGLAGRLNGDVARLKSFTTGNIGWDDVIVTFPEPGSFLDSLTSTASGRHGLLGGEIISRFTVIFDYEDERLYFKKNKQYKKKFSYNRSGLMVKAIGKTLDAYQIAEVRENSPGAQAGFLPGDMLHSINNLQANSLDLKHIVALLYGKPNKKLRLTVKRSGELIERSFRLVDEL